MRITKDESGQMLTIAGALEIGKAAELRSALRDFLEAASHPTLDLSQVDAVDAASLQMLCSARRTAERSGKLLQIFEPSAAVREKSETLGLPLTEFGAASAQENTANGI